MRMQTWTSTGGQSVCEPGLSNTMFTWERITTQAQQIRSKHASLQYTYVHGGAFGICKYKSVIIRWKDKLYTAPHQPSVYATFYQGCWN